MLDSLPLPVCKWLRAGRSRKVQGWVYCGYKRFVRRCEKGVWQRMLEHFAHDPDMKNGMIDSTVVRAHPCAARAQKKWGASPQAQSGVALAQNPSDGGWLGRSFAVYFDGGTVP